MKKRQNISALFTIAVFYLILESVFGITCPILFLTGISCAGWECREHGFVYSVWTSPELSDTIRFFGYYR